MSKTSIWPWVMAAGLALVGCGGKADDPMQTATVSSDDGNSSTSSTSGSPVTTTIGPSDTTLMTTAATGGSESSGSGQDSGSTGMVFLVEPDFDGCGGIIECNVFEQDCPKGEKCMPYDDCWGTWDSIRCSPIDDDPGQPGDECTVVGSATSGIDSCDLGAMCWYVDPQTNMGTCVAMCTGDESNPTCEDPDISCAIHEVFIALCLPSNCDPILQDCPAGEACYPLQDTWICAQDASGDNGVYDDWCWWFFNKCDPGYVCVSDNCTAVCDLTDPLGDAQCDGAAEGQICLPWYEEGAAPLGYDDVGVCMLPA